MADKAQVRTYPGRAISVRYDVKRCMHAAECVNSQLKEVFNLDNRPWIDPDNAAADEVAEVIERCPSGALQYERHDGGKDETTPNNRATPDPNGALYFQGELTVEDAKGHEITQDTRLALCRCGHSENKPFCDKSHTEAGFEDDGSVDDGFGPKGLEPTGPLTITVSHNGPLSINGKLAITSADGSSTVYRQSTALCRCGRSRYKPFCDGSHHGVTLDEA